METKSIDPRKPVPGHFCSVCGGALSKLEIDDELVIRATLGYGSKYDEQTHEVKFCQECFDALIDSCKRSTFVRDISDEPYVNAPFVEND